MMCFKKTHRWQQMHFSLEAACPPVTQVTCHLSLLRQLSVLNSTPVCQAKPALPFAQLLPLLSSSLSQYTSVLIFKTDLRGAVDAAANFLFPACGKDRKRT